MLNSSTAALVAFMALLVGMLMFGTSLILVFSTLLLILWLSTRRPAGFPPGPPLLPLVGNIFQLDADIRVSFSKFRRQYGDIFSMYIFNQPMIVMNGYNVLKDALVKNGDVFSDRPHSFLLDIFDQGKGIISTSGATWKKMRKFAVVTFKELGSSVTEENMQQELNNLSKALEDVGSEEFDCNQLIYTATANIISGVCFGKHPYKYNDPQFSKLTDAMDMLFSDMGNSEILDLFPVVRLLPGDAFNYKRLTRNVEVIRKEVARLVQERMNNFDEDNVEDVVTACMKEMRGSKQGDETFDETDLHMILNDLFMTGTLDAGNILKWSLLYLLHYPEVQEKCFQEIKEHIGLERQPTMMDKPNLPFLQATYSEMLRHADTVPVSVPHTTPYDVQFMGYTFPKGVTIMPMLHSVHHDQAIWGDPQNFRPGRFLDDEGKFQKREELVPFSLGRRACAGQPLARMELFLFWTTLIQRFKFVPPSGTLQPLVGSMGVSHTAPPFKCKAIPRKI